MRTSGHTSVRKQNATTAAVASVTVAFIFHFPASRQADSSTKYIQNPKTTVTPRLHCQILVCNSSETQVAALQ